MRGYAGRHIVTMDRKVEDGGADAGCTSGELLLLAVGSCAAGSTRRFLEDRGIDCLNLTLRVRYGPSPSGGAQNAIVVDLSLAEGIPEHLMAQLRDAILDGGVVGRLRRGTEFKIEAEPGT